MSESFVTEVSTASAAASSAAIGCLLIHEGDFPPRYAIKVIHLHLHTPSTVYKVPICPRGNLLYKQIYLTIDQKLHYEGILGL